MTVYTNPSATSFLFDHKSALDKNDNKEMIVSHSLEEVHPKSFGEKASLSIK